jgi:uncharacterized protein
MKFTQEAAGTGYVIQGYDQGQVTINGRAHHQSLIVTPDKLIESWGPKDFASLSMDDFSRLAELNLEMVILGTGSRHLFPHPGLLEPLTKRQIGLETMDTAAACRTYNILMAEGRRIAAALLMI